MDLHDENLEVLIPVSSQPDTASGSSGSDSGSTEEEERLRRLFIACDRDGDGFIDNQDLRYMCEQLNLEDAVDEIMQQLGVDETGRISFQDFMQCRQRLTHEIEEEKLRVDTSGAWLQTDSEHSSGMPPSSGEYDSGARDMSPEPPSMYTLMEKHNAEYLQQVMNTQYGPAILELTNSLHLTALTSLKSELLELNNKLQKLGNEKELVDRQLVKYKADNIFKQEEYGDRLEQQTCRYEDRITELHSVIAELRKKLDQKHFSIIREEDEPEEVLNAVRSEHSQDASVSINGNLSLNDSLSVNDNVSANDSNVSHSIDDDTGALDWEADMSQVIDTFNKALMAQQQLQQKHLSSSSDPLLPITSTPTKQKKWNTTEYMGNQQLDGSTPNQLQFVHNINKSISSPSLLRTKQTQNTSVQNLKMNNIPTVPVLKETKQSNLKTAIPDNNGAVLVSCKHNTFVYSSSVGAIDTGDSAVVYSKPLTTVGNSSGTMDTRTSPLCTKTVTSGGTSDTGVVSSSRGRLVQPVYTTPPYSQMRSSCTQPSVYSSQIHHADVSSVHNQFQPGGKTMQDETIALKDQIQRLETELHQTHKKLRNIRQERDGFKLTVENLQGQLHSKESVSHNILTTPTKPTCSSQQRWQGTDSEASPAKSKIAELIKLKTSCSSDNIDGVDGTLSLANTKVVEHLVQNIQESSSIQEIVHAASTSNNVFISENKVYEFEIEVERLQSKIDNLKAQNELLAIALEESKGHCDRMTELVGKCESNQTALHLAVGIGDQLVETMQSVISLLDSEQNLLMANCRAAGFGSTATTDSGMGDESSDELTDVIDKAKSNRRSTEQIARQLLARLDHTCSSAAVVDSHRSQTGLASPWEELSLTSRTTSTTSSTGSASDTEFSKLDEQRLKEYISHLKQERTAIKLTVLEMENVHIDPETDKPTPLPEGQRLDLENAVLMQELMALKEEKAEIKAENYLLEKEKAALDLQISGKESQEQAYIVQIEHLKSEITEWQQKLGHDVKTNKDDNTATPSITLAELKTMGMDSSQLAQDLAEALKREQLLRKRVSELMATLERLSKNSESRHKQSAEFVSDLKKANSALVSAFEKTKKKYQSKLKKIETQFQETTQRYEAKIASLQGKAFSMPRQPGVEPTCTDNVLSSSGEVT